MKFPIFSRTISPRMALQVTPDEATQISKLEREINTSIKSAVARSSPVVSVPTEDMSLRVIEATMRKYQEAGWKVSYQEGDHVLNIEVEKTYQRPFDSF